jgi:GLPGLI family protein
MKNLFLFVLLFGYLNLWSQVKGKITYLVSLDKSTFEAPYENPENTQEQNDALELLHNAQNVESYLIFNDSISGYYVEDKDTPKFEYFDGAMSINPTVVHLTWIRAGGERYFYTDWSRDYNISTFDFMGNKKRLIIETNDWIITEEKKEIMGYLCQKAVDISNAKRIVWFTEDIPVKHGPRGTNGLPGLILEFYDNKFSYIVQDIELDYQEFEEIYEPKDGDLITYEELKSLAGNPFGN